MGRDIKSFEHPAVAVDVLIFTIQDQKLKMILIKRGAQPFKDSWAIPGGFVHMDESLEEAAIRELAEEAGVKDVYLEQLYTFGEVDRDPRMRVISVAYFALVPGEKLNLHADTDATDAAWFDVKNLPDLAFDHKEIINTAINRLKSKLEYSSIAQGLLPKKFRLSELQKVYEIILGSSIDKRNFRKKMLSLNLLKATGEKFTDGAHRPAELYEFKDTKPVIFD